MASNHENIITQVKSIVATLYDVVSSRPHDIEAYIQSARFAMTSLDNVSFFQDSVRFAEQVWILQGLQQFACQDADHGCIDDIAEYSQACWLILLRRFPEHQVVLTGLGRNWLQRSQEILARIQRDESNNLSNGGSNSQASSSDPRGQGPHYLEARGFLQPAIDFYRRAVNAADDSSTISGDLLASAAEAYMSLGNVTASPADETLFNQALLYLRRADTMPGYELSTYLQQYLTDFGRYIT